MKTFAALVAMSILALSATSQEGLEQKQGSQNRAVKVSSLETRGNTGVAVGLPYSAEQVTYLHQRLTDGTNIHQTLQRTMLYRDSRGRSRSERVMFRFANGLSRSGPRRIEITDPVRGYQYLLDEQSHSAHRTKIVGATEADTSSTLPKNTGGIALKIDPSQEPLGSRIINGVSAEGKRLTVTYKTGAIGNDRPIKVVSEIWSSKTFRLLLLSQVKDPRNGNLLTKLERFSKEEPPPSLFDIPASYSIDDSH